MHQQQRQFIRSVAACHPDQFRGTSVLELGSYNINGSVREFFSDPAEYVGVDWRPGPDVDIVSLCHELEFDGGPRFDVLISSEMLEHDPHWQGSIKRGLEYLKPEGLVIITCAAPARGAHEVEVSPDSKHYAGVHARKLQGFMDSLGVRGAAEPGWDGLDTYYSGIKL